MHLKLLAFVINENNTNLWFNINLLTFLQKSGKRLSCPYCQEFKNLDQMIDGTNIQGVTEFFCSQRCVALSQASPSLTGTFCVLMEYYEDLSTHKIKRITLKYLIIKTSYDRVSTYVDITILVVCTKVLKPVAHKSGHTHCHLVVSEEKNTLHRNFKMAANPPEKSSSHNRPKHRQGKQFNC